MGITTLDIVNICSYFRYLIYFNSLVLQYSGMSSKINPITSILTHFFRLSYPKIFIKVLGERSVQGALVHQEWCAGEAGQASEAYALCPFQGSQSFTLKNQSQL